MTALQALEALRLAKGERLLIVGATGGVGSFAVQLAAQQGAIVIATARPGTEEELVRGLGAAETIDYSQGAVAETVRAQFPDGIDALLNLVDMGEDFAKLAELVIPGGRAATTMNAADVEKLATQDVSATNVMVAPDGGRLGRLTEMADAGSLKVPVQNVYPLERAADAIGEFQKGTRGKLAITVS
jgi:NADPH:quinone reductase